MSSVQEMQGSDHMYINYRFKFFKSQICFGAQEMSLRGRDDANFAH